MELLQNPITSYVVTFLSILLTIYFFYKSYKLKKPRYAIKSVNIIDESVKLQDIKLIYRDTEVEKLTVSKIVIWNKGRETVNYSDLAEKSKLGIFIDPQYKIMNVEILQVSDEINGFETIKEDEGYLINFDFLDKNQGAVFKVTHSGNDSSDLLVNGVFKGIGKIVNIEENPLLLKVSTMTRMSYRSVRLSSLLLILFLELIVLSATVYYVSYFIYDVNKEPISSLDLFSCIMVTLWINVFSFIIYIMIDGNKKREAVFLQNLECF